MSRADRLLVALALLTVPLSGCIVGSGDGESVSVEAGGTGAWVLPGPRSLDPAVFGTPGQPALLHDLPTDQRGISPDGCRFTQTTQPTPFSNRTANVSGSLDLEVTDRTPRDDPASEDEAHLDAEWTSPDDNHTYRVASDRVIPQGPAHPFLGGVGTDVVIHGTTGIGTPLMPRALAYVTMWGVASFERDGEVLAEDRLVHAMVTERIRDDELNLPFAPAKPSELEVHLVLPPTRVGEEGPQPAPLPTGFATPGGEQPFVHLTFYDVDVDNDPFLDEDRRPPSPSDGHPGHAHRSGAHGGTPLTEADCVDVTAQLNGTVTEQGYEANASLPVGTAGPDLSASIELTGATTTARLTLTLEDPSGEALASATVTPAQPQAGVSVEDVGSTGTHQLVVAGDAAQATYQADATVDYEGPSLGPSGGG